MHRLFLFLSAFLIYVNNAWMHKRIIGCFNGGKGGTFNSGVVVNFTLPTFVQFNHNSRIKSPTFAPVKATNYPFVHPSIVDINEESLYAKIEPLSICCS